MTDTNEHDQGVLFTLVERLKEFRIPRALAIQDKVERGERLNDYDLAFMEEVFAEANQNVHLIERHPEYLDLVGRLTNLYNEIMARAMENENKGRD